MERCTPLIWPSSRSSGRFLTSSLNRNTSAVASTIADSIPPREALVDFYKSVGDDVIWVVGTWRNVQIPTEPSEMSGPDRGISLTESFDCMKRVIAARHGDFIQVTAPCATLFRS